MEKKESLNKISTKQKIFSLLLEQNNSPISGEVLAEKCNVSRTAIWKSINALREEGYLIDGTTNNGYILKKENDVFSRESFLSYFISSYPDFSKSNIECFSEIDSTNNYAKRLLSESQNLFDTQENFTQTGYKLNNSVIIAETQTSGRGRLGRTFISPKRTGIYLSIIHIPKGGIKDPSQITAISAVAVCRAIKKLFKFSPQIKWVNDIFYKNKKIAGILTEGIYNFETKQIESAVIGIGINIFDNPIFVKDNIKIAGSICGDMKTSQSIPRMKLAAQITGEVLSILNEDKQKVICEYKENSLLIGKQITVFPVIGDISKSFTAKAIDINQNAELVVELSDGTQKNLNSGEVTIKSESLCE